MPSLSKLEMSIDFRGNLEHLFTYIWAVKNYFNTRMIFTQLQVFRKRLIAGIILYVVKVTSKLFPV